MPDDRAQQQQDRHDQPVEARRENQRVMIAHHQRNHRQGQVVVVHRTKLAGLAERGIGRLSGQQCGDDLLLVGNDDEEHVGDHDGADDGTDLVQRAASAQDMRESVGQSNQKQIATDRKRQFMFGQAALAGGIVEQPRDHETSEAEGGRLQRREVEDRLVDQEQLGIEIVDDDHQDEAGQPRRIGLPFEPGQLVGHRLRRDQIFDDPVEAAAMDLPGAALDAVRKVTSRLQAEIEVNEIERAADPCHGSHDMQPSKDQTSPVGQDGLPHHRGLSPANCIAAPRY